MAFIRPVLVGSLLVAMLAVAPLGAGCGNGAGGKAPDASGKAGTQGTAGASGSQGTAGGTAGASGSQGTAGAAGSQGPAGQGGQTSGTGGEGAGGQGGSAGGTSSDGGAGSTSSDAGDGPVTTPDAGSDARPTGKQWSCPAGPFEAPKAGASQNICPGFKVKYGWSEGPTWIASQKAFFFSNFVINQAGPGDMIKFTPDTGTCVFFIEGNGCNGLGVAPNGNIMGACHTPRAIMEYDPVTKQAKTLANMAEGKLLDSPNDLVAHSNGTIYFTNPTFELGGRPQGLGSALLQLSPAGAVTVIARGGLNGIALSPDEKRLYVVGMGVWDLDDAGVLSNRRAFTLGGDGIAMDCAGNVYDNGGNIRNPQGQTVGNFPGGTNMAFGGPDGKTLLVVGGTGAHTVQMNVPGLP